MPSLLQFEIMQYISHYIDRLMAGLYLVANPKVGDCDESLDGKLDSKGLQLVGGANS